jgi:hypothetical protein
MQAMRAKWLAVAVGISLLCFGSFAVHAESDGAVAALGAQQLAKIIPGQSNKADIQAMLGAPWRVVQFNDCGMAMDDQADETWEYRGADSSGGFRVHVEFGDDGVVHLVAKISDGTAGGQPTVAKVKPAEPGKGMSM